MGCSNKYGDWCQEFAACGKLDLFDNNDDYDDDDDATNDKDDGNKEGKEGDPEVIAMENVCDKSVINNGDNYNECKELCQARECCFHWGKENCVEEKEDWCDDFRLCYNLDWADEDENVNSKGDLQLVIK